MEQAPPTGLDSAGVHIGETRTRRGVAPAVVAHALGVSEAYYLTEIETGKTRLDIGEVAACADALSVTTRELLGMELSAPARLAQRLRDL
jgi:transcriptional regulator with XRE-family HTH domain